MKNSRTSRSAYLRPAGIFLLCALFIVLAGYALFENIKANEKNDTGQTLVSVGRLKAHQIQSYLSERKGDATIVSSFLAAPAAQLWLAHRGGHAPETLDQLAESVVKTHQYRGLLLLDGGANIRLNTGHSGNLTEAGKAIALRTMRERSPASFQIYFGDPSTPDVPVLDTFVPIMSPDGTLAVGMVVMRNELNYLFQLLQALPIESETAESLLVTKDGGDVLFLNELRHRKDTALKLRIPLSSDPGARAWPAISAATGHSGLLEANDYRNRRILAYTLTVPDTSWGIVVKMDIEEAVAHSLRLLRIAMVVVVILIAFTGVIVWLWWRKDQADQLANRQLQDSEIRYRRLHESMMDAFVMVDMSGHLLDFNHTFREMLGYSAEELLRLSCADLTPEKWHEFEKRIIAEQVIPNGQSQVYEKEYIRKDRTVLPVELKFYLLTDKKNQPEAMWAIVRDITERRLAQLNLQHNQDLLKEAQRLGQLGCWELNLTSGELYWTDEVYRIFELDPARFSPSYENFLNVIHPDDRDKVNQAYTESLEHRRPYDVVHRLLFAEGRIKWVREHCNSEFDASGKPLRSVGAVQDITRQKLTEDAIAREGERFRTLFESISDAIIICDMEGHIIQVNRSACERLGYSKEELQRMTPADIDTPEYAAKVAERFREIRKQGRLVFESAHVRKDGTVIPIELNARVVDYDGQPAVLSVARDITERKQAEEQLRKSSEEIADLYNHAPCGYHSLDKDGNIRLMNDTELSWLGYARGEVIGKMKWQDLLAPGSIQTFRESFPQLMQQGFGRDIELEIVRKDGTTFTGLVNATAIYDRVGNYVMSRSTITDISERKRARRELQDLSAHLQTVREEEKASIAREIHDDLGGTLTALKMEAYWLAEELSANQETEPLLKHVELMSQLTENAVNVTRRVITGLRPTILDDLGLLAAIEWQAEQFRKHTGIECRVNGTEDKVKLDKQYSIALFRIFQEALTNVARHSGASKVEVEFHCGQEEVMLSISDNGRGLPEGHTIASGSYGMRGMSERVKQLGGKIKFENAPGGGFSVAVTLPLYSEKRKEARS